LPLFPTWCYRLLAAGLILGVTAARLAFLLCDCPLDLAPDEAHYWHWSQNLDWSYYSKGPLVAWLIRASCDLVGPLALSLTGSLVPALRLPAVLCGALLLTALYVLTVQVFRREALALGVVALALTVPVTSAGASLMTIDAPYACCWSWALVLAHRAVFRGSGWAWPLAGLVIGLGILAKYTMVLFLPSLGLFLLTSSEHRRMLARPGFWVLCGVSAGCCLPILVWNIQNDWVTVRHLLTLSGLAPRDKPRIYWLGPLQMMVGQAALLLMGFVCWLLAMTAHRPWREQDRGVRYLWWLSAPMFGVFLAFSFKTDGGQINWPVTAYLSGVVLMAHWLARQLVSERMWWRRLVQVNLLLNCVAGIGLTVVLHRTELLLPVLVRLAGPPTESNPWPLRNFDPTCRLRGWRELGEAVDRVRQRVAAEEGTEPVLAGYRWDMPGELNFYCQGHPAVYSLGPALGDRHSQYDLWHNPIDDPAAFRGRTFIVVGVWGPPLLPAFAPGGVEEAGVVMHRAQGQPITWWPILVCRGYQGMQRLTGRQGY
jgi:hypothetical protein